MKKYSIFILFALAVACGSPKEEETTTKCSYEIDTNSLDFVWTAYKFTEKTGVNGTFSDISVSSTAEADTLVEFLNSVSFEINADSVFSNEPARDVKIAHFFFGTMSNTKMIKGKIKDAGSDPKVTLTINDLTLDLPAKLTYSGDTVSLSTTVDFEEFNAHEALATLNQVCELEHTGTDGKSVFWSDVAINVKAIVRKSCD